MGIQEICDKIAADARAEAEAIIAAAQKTADRVKAEAAERIACADKAEREETGVKVKGISDGYAASARLEANKTALAGRRAVLDEVYSRALARLLAMDKEDFLALCARLIEAYAEEGDEIVFAASFPYRKEIGALPVVQRLKLNISFGKGGGEGMLLCGKTSDKDLSFAALLQEDRALHEAEVAAELFK